jgi:hypothetical protein
VWHSQTAIKEETLPFIIDILWPYKTPESLSASINFLYSR